MKIKMENRLNGVFSLLLTPFTHGGEIDWEVYNEYVDWQLSHKAQGVFAVCGSSEMNLLTMDERVKLASIAVKRANGTPVIATANIGADPMLHDEEIQRIVETGVSSIVLVPPNGYATDPMRLEEYFMKMSEVATIPTILYECPLFTPYYIPAPVYANLVKGGKVIGIKDTTCTLEGITAKINAAPSSVVFQANTPFLLDSIRHGAKGIMATTSTAKADLVMRFWESAQAQRDDMLQLHEQLVFLDGLLSRGFTATGKYLVALQGIAMETTTRSGNTLNASTAKALQVWYEAFQQI